MPNFDHLPTEDETDSWIAKAGCGVLIVFAVIFLGLGSLIVWGIIELIQLIGRLG